MIGPKMKKKSTVAHLDWFYKTSQIKNPENQFHNNNKIIRKQQSYGNSSTLQYPNNKPYNNVNSNCNNWRKQRYENNKCDWRKQ